jgi:hypothetical protein
LKRKVGLTDSCVQNLLLWLICLSVIHPSIHSSTPFTTEQHPPLPN